MSVLPLAAQPCLSQRARVSMCNGTPVVRARSARTHWVVATLPEKRIITMTAKQANKQTRHHASLCPLAQKQSFTWPKQARTHNRSPLATHPPPMKKVGQDRKLSGQQLTTRTKPSHMGPGTQTTAPKAAITGVIHRLAKPCWAHNRTKTNAPTQSLLRTSRNEHLADHAAHVSQKQHNDPKHKQTYHHEKACICL